MMIDGGYIRAVGGETRPFEESTHASLYYFSDKKKGFVLNAMR